MPIHTAVPYQNNSWLHLYGVRLLQDLALLNTFIAWFTEDENSARFAELRRNPDATDALAQRLGVPWLPRVPLGLPPVLPAPPSAADEAEPGVLSEYLWQRLQQLIACQYDPEQSEQLREWANASARRYDAYVEVCSVWEGLLHAVLATLFAGVPSRALPLPGSVDLPGLQTLAMQAGIHYRELRERTLPVTAPPHSFTARRFSKEVHTDTEQRFFCMLNAGSSMSVQLSVSERIITVLGGEAYVINYGSPGWPLIVRTADLVLYPRAMRGSVCNHGDGRVSIALLAGHLRVERCVEPSAEKIGTVPVCELSGFTQTRICAHGHHSIAFDRATADRLFAWLGQRW
jgi:hypothetical protein